MSVSALSTKESPGAMRLAAEAGTSSSWIDRYVLQHLLVAAQT